MHPGMMGWWLKRERARHECASHACASDSRSEGHGHEHHGWHAHWSGGDASFGVRRPLRFLSHKLDLDEKQSAALARILDELKTERAQAAVDERRAVAAFADAIEGASFDAEKARSAGEQRVASAARLRDAVVAALGKLHALLREEQRQELATMLRAGVLAI